MPTRRRRRLYFWLGILSLLVLLTVLAWRMALPAIVRGQVRSVLAKAGYDDVSFEVASAGAWGAEIINLNSGEGGALGASSLRIDYSPWAAFRGKIDAIRLERANILIDLDQTRPDQAKRHFDLWSAANAKGLPLWRIDLADCKLTFLRDGNRFSVRADGWMWREKEDDRARISLALRAGERHATTGWLEGDVRFARREFDASAGASNVEIDKVLPFLPDTLSQRIAGAGGKTTLIATIVYGDGRAQTSGSVELRGIHATAPDWHVTVEGADANIEFASLNPLRTSAGQRVRVNRVKIGQSNELTELDIAFDVDRRGLQSATAPTSAPFAIPPTVRFESIRCNWAGGTLASDGPAFVHPTDRSVAIRLLVDKVGLDPTLQLITSGKVSGKGTLSGRLPIRIQWPHVSFGTGRIASDGPGELNFGQQVGDLAKSVAQHDSRFAGQENQLVAALSRFRYDHIVFEFNREPDGLEVTSSISGRGLQGVTTPIELTVRYAGLEEALNAYLATSLRVNPTAGQ